MSSVALDVRVAWDYGFTDVDGKRPPVLSLASA